MKLAIAKLPEFWRGITRNRDIERSAREWMEGYDAALAYCAEQLDQALSHAAGQDGEQCRAASGLSDADIEFMANEMAGRLGEDSGYMEDMLRGLLRALSRGVPEGMVLVPIDPTPEMETAHRMYGDTSDWWQAVTSAAIAAQRKEG